MASVMNGEIRPGSGDDPPAFVTAEVWQAVLAELAADDVRIAAPPPRPDSELPPMAACAPPVARPSRRQSCLPVKHDKDADWWHGMKQAICISVILLGAVLFCRSLPAFRSEAARPSSAVPTAGASSAAPIAENRPLRTRSIRDIRVGDRIVGRNPIREQADLVEPDPATWRKVSLHMTKETGLGLWIDLLRPLTWIEEHGAEPGSTIFIDLYEMGAVGDAEVLALESCPPIPTGTGTIVTGTFRHEADEHTQVIHLKLEDQIELTEVTDNHPYWSADRQNFVEAGKLRPGELVDTEYGLKRVLALTPLEHTGFLYNLETTEHVYRVGSLGTLVHNSCVIHGNPQPTSAAHAKSMQDMANRMAKSGAYTDVYMHSQWSTILKGKGVTVAPNRLPDVAGVRHDGKIDIIEFASSARDHKHGNLLGRNRDIWNQLPEPLRGDILIYDELGNLTHVFP